MLIEKLKKYHDSILDYAQMEKCVLIPEKLLTKEQKELVDKNRTDDQQIIDALLKEK